MALALSPAPAVAEQPLPSHAEYTVRRDLRTAWTVWARGDLDRAEAMAATALQRQVSAELDGQARRMLCGLRVARGSWDDALDVCAQWSEAEADHPEAKLLLGRVLLEQGAADLARQAYARAEELAPTDPRAALGLGLVAARLDRDPDALAAALRRARSLGHRLAALPQAAGWEPLAEDESFLATLTAVLNE